MRIWDTPRRLPVVLIGSQISRGLRMPAFSWTWFSSNGNKAVLAVIFSPVVIRFQWVLCRFVAPLRGNPTSQESLQIESHLWKNGDKGVLISFDESLIWWRTRILMVFRFVVSGLNEFFWFMWEMPKQVDSYVKQIRNLFNQFVRHMRLVMIFNRRRSLTYLYWYSIADSKTLRCNASLDVHEPHGIRSYLALGFRQEYFVSSTMGWALHSISRLVQQVRQVPIHCKACRVPDARAVRCPSRSASLNGELVWSFCLHTLLYFLCRNTYIFFFCIIKYSFLGKVPQFAISRRSHMDFTFQNPFWDFTNNWQ